MEVMITKKVDRVGILLQYPGLRHCQRINIIVWVGRSEKPTVKHAPVLGGNITALANSFHASWRLFVRALMMGDDDGCCPAHPKSKSSKRQYDHVASQEVQKYSVVVCSLLFVVCCCADCAVAWFAVVFPVARPSKPNQKKNKTLYLSPQKRERRKKKEAGESRLLTGGRDRRPPIILHADEFLDVGDACHELGVREISQPPKGRLLAEIVSPSFNVRHGDFYAIDDHVTANAGSKTN